MEQKSVIYCNLAMALGSMNKFLKVFIHQCNVALYGFETSKKCTEEIRKQDKF